MAVERQVLLVLAVIVAAATALWLIGEILLPFVAGLVLAYLLVPPTDALERFGLPRSVAALTLLGLVVLLFVVLVLLIAPILLQQLYSLLQQIPGYVRRLQELIADPSHPWLRRLSGVSGGDVSASDLVNQGVSWIATFLRSLWSGGRTLISVVSILVVTPVVAFYFIYDWHRMIATIDRWVPLRHRETVRRLAREIGVAIGGFVRGQTAVCLILGSYYAVGLSIVGLNYGLLIGLISGLITFIPYLGSMTGLLLAMSIAVAQFWPDWSLILVVLGIFLMGQFIEGNVLAPKLVGESVGLHPVWLIFALVFFGYLFGFIGLLVAVPLAAAGGVLTRFGLARYLGSAFYTGEPRP